MGDQLNQNQIDDLLKRLTGDGDSGEIDQTERIDGRVVKDYDFSSPKKFTKEQLRLLEDLHEGFARIAANYFSGFLRQYCEISVTEIEEQLYYDFTSALPDSALIGLYELRPKDSHYDDLSITMNVSTVIGYYVLERMLGGQGSTDAPDRTYTELEISILENTLQKLCATFASAWQSYVECTCEFTGIETNSRLMQTLPPKEIVVVVMTEVKINSIYIGNIDLCIPASQLGDLINSFNSKYQTTSKRTLPDAGATKKKLLDSIVGSDVVVTAILDELMLDVQDVLNLHVNDIIPLNKAIDSDVMVNVDGVPWFDGKLGEVRQKKAIKLNHLINQDVNLEKGDFYGSK